MYPFRNVDTVLPLVSPFIVGAPEPVQRQAIGLALRDFCRDTEIWRETIDVTTVTDQATYALADEMNNRFATLLRVRQLRFDDEDDPISEEYYTVSVADEIVFDDPYSDDFGDEMNVDAVILPNVDARSCPAWLLARWQEYIAEGALYRLKSQEGKPWTNLQAAQIHLGRYQYGVGEAKRENNTGRQSGQLRVTPGNFV